LKALQALQNAKRKKSIDLFFFAKKSIDLVRHLSVYPATNQQPTNQTCHLLFNLGTTKLKAADYTIKGLKESLGDRTATWS
jgi:hypothetical protein